MVYVSFMSWYLKAIEKVQFMWVSMKSWYHFADFYIIFENTVDPSNIHI